MDYAALRDIPILKVADDLGIDVKGRKAMCFAGHDDKTPSLSFWVEKNIWKCFGCGLGGSTIDLVQNVLDMPDVTAAAKWLDARYRIGSAASQIRQRKAGKGLAIASHNSTRNDTRVGKIQRDPEIYEWLIDQCPLGERGRAFLTDERKLSEDTINQFRIGEIVDSNSVYAAMNKKWGAKRLSRSGLMTSRSGSSAKDSITGRIFYGPCLLFAFLDDGQIVYLQARNHTKRGPKYMSLAGIPIPMFNLDRLKAARPNSNVYICEGVTDAIAAAELGWTAVGILGSASFRTEWVSLFRDVNPVIVPDNDHSGRNFKESIQRSFQEVGRVVNSISIEEFNDLSDLVRHKNR